MKRTPKTKTETFMKVRLVSSVVFTVGLFTTYIGLAGLEESTLTPALVGSIGVLICFAGNRMLEWSRDLEIESKK